jgi:hypothetical protein
MKTSFSLMLALTVLGTVIHLCIVDAIFNAEKGNYTIVWFKPHFIYQLKTLKYINSMIHLYLALKVHVTASMRERDLV